MMSQYKVLLAASLLACGLLTTSASAGLVVAVQTGVTAINPCPSFCRGDHFFSDIDGGIGQTASFSQLSLGDQQRNDTNNYGAGRAQSDLTGPTDLPVLKAEAFAQPNSGASAQAFGMQGFFYDGTGNGNYLLDVALTGIVSGGTARADILIFRDNDAATDTQFSSDTGTMRFEVIALSGGELSEFAFATLGLPSTNTPQSVATQLAISGLNRGDLFYVWANLITSSFRGASADAFNTLNVAFTDPRGLSHTPPTASVPEPATGLVLLAGLGLLGVLRRR